MSTQSTKLVLIATVAIAIGLAAWGILVAEQTARGQTTTRPALRAKVKAQQQRMTQQQSARAKLVQTSSKSRLAIEQLLQTQQQKFAAESAKVQTELKRLRQFGPATIYGQTTAEVRASTQKQSGLNILPPQITKVFGMIHPGGLVLIGGNYFGNITGRVRIIVPNASWEILLEKLEWHPTGIAGPACFAVARFFYSR